MPDTAVARRGTRPSADATRDAILTAALDEFADRSFDGATMRAIATRAGVTQPLLNYHFSAKDELWRAAVDRLFASLEGVISSRAAGLRGVDELTAAKLLVREFVEFSARHPQLHRIITAESKADGPRLDWLVDQHVQPIYDATTELFARLTALGHLPAVPPVHLYYLLTGAAPTMFVQAPECRRLSGVDPFADETIAAHADAVVAMLFGAGTVR